MGLLTEFRTTLVQVTHYAPLSNSGLVHWDDPEGWDGEEGGREVQDGEHMNSHGRFM